MNKRYIFTFLFIIILFFTGCEKVVQYIYIDSSDDDNSENLSYSLNDNINTNSESLPDSFIADNSSVADVNLHLTNNYYKPTIKKVITITEPNCENRENREINSSEEESTSTNDLFVDDVFEGQVINADIKELLIPKNPSIKYTSIGTQDLKYDFDDLVFRFSCNSMDLRKYSFENVSDKPITLVSFNLKIYGADDVLWADITYQSGRKIKPKEVLSDHLVIDTCYLKMDLDKINYRCGWKYEMSYTITY